MLKQITVEITSLAMHSSLIHDLLFMFLCSMIMILVGETKTAFVTLTDMTKMAENSDKHQKVIWSDGSLF